MKKIIALALALIMALSMASVAFAATAVNGTANNNHTITENPGEKITITCDQWDNKGLTGYKVSTDFTSSAKEYNGASYIESVKILKDKETVEVTLKENFTLSDAKSIKGEIVLTKKDAATYKQILTITVNNTPETVVGAKKATAVLDVVDGGKNVVVIMDEDGGYVAYNPTADLTGVVKMNKDEKAQVYFLNAAETEAADEDLYDAVDAYLGEDYEGIVEWYNFCGTGFKADVDFTYDAYAEDPHFFYIWDGEKFVDLEGKYNDDEEVEAYEFTAPAKGLIIVTDVELVAAAEETKNPDTGANDVVGVAAALAVVSLVAAGAVSLKK